MRALLGWVTGHARTATGLAFFVPSLWRGLLTALGWAGDVDLVISKYSDPGWVGVMLHALLDPPAWFNLALIPLGFGLIYWDIIRHRRTVVSRVSQPLAASVVRPKPIVGVSKVAAIVEPIPGADPSLLKLFRLDDEGRVELRFLPDGGDVEGKALLLVVYGYKVLRGLRSVSVAGARHEVLRAVGHAPNATLGAKISPMMEFTRLLGNEDIGSNAIKRGLLRRIRLSEGGYFELTEPGFIEADHLTRDLIERA